MAKIISSLEAIDKALEAYRRIEGNTSGLKLETIEPLKDKKGWVIGLSRDEYQGFLNHRVTNYNITVTIFPPISKDDHDVTLAVESIVKVGKNE